jgi:hypothetical protein
VKIIWQGLIIGLLFLPAQAFARAVVAKCSAVKPFHETIMPRSVYQDLRQACEVCTDWEVRDATDEEITDKINLDLQETYIDYKYDYFDEKTYGGRRATPEELERSMKRERKILEQWYFHDKNP